MAALWADNFRRKTKKDWRSLVASRAASLGSPGDFVCFALGLVRLTFGLHLLFVGRFADSVFHGAFGLVVGAFHMLFR